MNGYWSEKLFIGQFPIFIRQLAGLPAVPSRAIRRSLGWLNVRSTGAAVRTIESPRPIQPVK
jgi:hypothetical protein